MKPSISLLCMALFATVADGATVEISTEGWTGSGNTNGWKFASLGTNGTMTTESFINSPIWPEAIVLYAAVTLAGSRTNPPQGFALIIQ